MNLLYRTKLYDYMNRNARSEREKVDADESATCSQLVDQFSDHFRARMI